MAIKEKDTDRLHKELDPIAEYLFSKSQEKPDAVTADDLEMVGFFGQMLAYLEHVDIKSGRVTPQRAKQLRIKLETGLSPALKTAMVTEAKQVNDKLAAELAQFEIRVAAGQKVVERAIADLEAEVAAQRPGFEATRDKATKAKTAYDAAWEPQRERWIQLKNRLVQLNRDIDAISRLDRTPPTPPKPDPETGVTKPADEQKYRQAKADFDRDQKEYERERKRLPSLRQEGDRTSSEIAAIEASVAPLLQAMQAAATEFETARKLFEELKDRLDQRRSDLQRRPDPHGPGGIVSQPITSYGIFSVAKEVRRIERAYGQ